MSRDVALLGAAIVVLCFGDFSQGGPIEEIRPGDRVFFEPGEKRQPQEGRPACNGL